MDCNPVSGYPIRVEGIESSSIVHCGSRKTFLIVTDWGAGGQARVEVDLDTLGLAPAFRVQDFESNEPVACSGNTITFSLKKHDYRTLVLSARADE